MKKNLHLPHINKQFVLTEYKKKRINQLCLSEQIKEKENGNMHPREKQQYRDQQQREELMKQQKIKSKIFIHTLHERI